MQTPNISTWLCGAALACLIAWYSAPARAQGMDQQQVTGMESGASPSAQVNAEVSGGMNGGGGSGSANFSGSGGASAAAALSGAAAPSSPEFGSQRAQYARGLNTRTRGAGALTKTRGSAVDRGKVKGMPAASRPSAPHGYRAARAAHNPQAMEAALASAGLKSSLAGATPGAIRGAAPETARYSDDFQDSTRGTALISPPDPGTTGPFGFSTEMDIKLPGFSERQFLSPTLHVGGPSRDKRNGRGGSRKRDRTPAVSRSGLSVSTSIMDDLGLDVLKDDLGNGLTSDPASDLGMNLGTSDNQQ